MFEGSSLCFTLYMKVAMYCTRMLYSENKLIHVSKSSNARFQSQKTTLRPLSFTRSRFVLSIALQKCQARLQLKRYPACSAATNREIKFDVTWPYVKRQTAKMTSEFVFFSSNPSLNHIKIEKCLLLIATNTNIFTLLFNELNTDGKSFIFAVCRLTYDHVTSNLISLIAHNHLSTVKSN